MQLQQQHSLHPKQLKLCIAFHPFKYFYCFIILEIGCLAYLAIRVRFAKCSNQFHLSRTSKALLSSVLMATDMTCNGFDCGK